MRNYDSTAESIVSLLGKLFHFKTVMDVGCTEKAWLKAFKKSGAEVFGVCMVGHPVDFHEEGIRTQDIDFGSTRFNVQRKQDLALSLDFAEKFPADFVGRYIDDLTGISDVILFSSQLPVLSAVGKTGQEKYPAHWQRLFEARGFVAIDCIRPQIWKMDDVLLEYKQGMVLYVREKSLAQYPKLFDFYLKHEGENVLDMVHPAVYRNSVNFFQGKVNVLKAEVEKLNRKPKRVLYVFYHGASLAWSLVHMFTVHSTDYVYFLVTEDMAGWRRADKSYILKRLVNERIVNGVYTYRTMIGMDTEKFDTVEKCESEIARGLEEDLEKQFCDLNNFDYIYVLTDVYDNVGIYCSLKQIPYFYCELSRGQFAMNGNENAVKFLNKSKPIYRDVLLKHKTTMCQSPIQSIITYPDTECVKRADGRVCVFDIEKAAENLSNNCKNIIKAIFNTKNVPIANDVAMILTQGPYDTIEVYNDWQIVKNRYKNHRTYTLSTIQCMQDYFIPTGCIPVIKLHPEVYTENGIEKYFDGAYVYHNLFTTVLMKLLPEECNNPKYIVHNNFTTSRKSFKENTKEIVCPGVLRCSVFLHKYYISLRILAYLNSLGSDTHRHFGGIGEKGEYGRYNTVKLSVDIEFMIKTQFLNVQAQSVGSYCVLQVNPETIVDESASRDFLIYTDVWENLSLEQLQEICQQVHTGIIKISKNPIKPAEDILVPLQDEYIFFFSKDESYIEKLKEFSAVKINKAMGIELNARMISVEEYKNSMK